jgi:hypothetical protein
MQDDSDQTDADRAHEGYQQRYEKERRASYGVVIFGLLAFVVAILAAFMHHMGFGANGYANIEPAAGDANTIAVPAPADNSGMNTTDTNTTDTNTVTNTTNTTP